MRKKSISKAIAFAAIAIAAASSTPSFARVIHRHPTASKHAEEQAPAVPLTAIHVLGDRPAPFALDAKAAMMIDGDTGAVLYAFNEHQKMQPASLAKIMTFYLTLDALKAGKIIPATDVTISEKAWRLSMDDTVSRMFLGVGQKVAVNDLLYGLMVSSGNDAAVALAEYLGGSTDAFTQMMNDKAREIGLIETHFENPDGLPAPGEFTTAADMVALAHSLVRHHPEALKYTSDKEFAFDKIKQPNFNTLLFYDKRVNGIKTGHVNEAGYHLVASASSNGMNLLSAVMGAPSAARRRTETEKLIDWAFRAFVSYRPDLSKAIPAAIPVRDGVAEAVAIGPQGAAVFTLGRGEESKVTVQFEPAARYLEAPVQPGVAVGDLAVLLNGKPQAGIPIVTKAGVARAGLFGRLGQKLRRIL
ncbi:D-alanyl-D-alanine carboxypeptidase family protein [Candidatus Binatus sp.]|uniref:D-alanyl-D-alanine carboxypeptidase family protein n=1 Tax=Candidatus Binatus sp. TaxID=2811406 RepID=UPI002F92CC87